MKKRNKILFTLLSTSALLAACGDNGNETGTDTSIQNDSESVAVPEGIMDPYEETVTITTVRDNPTAVDFRDGDTLEDNTWTRAWKDRFNIEVDYQWVADDYATNLNLSIAEGSIPDVMLVDYQQMQQLYEADMLLEISDLFEEYANDNLKDYMEYDSETFETAFFEDGLYGIPQLSYGYIDQFPPMWIRNDWLEEVGADNPETMDDMLAIARSFKEEFGGYPISENQNLLGMNFSAVAWDAYPNTWIENDSGEIVYGSIQPEMKEVLSAWRGFYEEGLINPEFAVRDSDAEYQALMNSESGIQFHYQWWGYTPGVDLVSNLGPDALFIPHPVPTATGEDLMHPIRYNNTGYVVISKDMKNPEATFKLLNFFAYMMDDAPGNESTEFVESLFTRDYSPALPHAFRVINPENDNIQYAIVSEAVEKYYAGEEVDVEALGSHAVKYLDIVRWIEDKDPQGVGNWLQQGHEMSAYAYAQDMMDNDQYFSDKLWGVQPNTLATTGSTLNDILIEGFTQIITGAQEVDYFDTLIENWNVSGGEQATIEMNEMYGE